MGSRPPRTPGRTARLTRAVALVLTALAVSSAAGRLFWASGSDALAVVTAGGPASPTDLLLLMACTAGLALTGWLCLAVLVATAAALPGLGGRAVALLADRWAPALVRRAVAAALGGALVAGLPTVAHADAPRPAPVATQAAVAPAPDPAFAVTGSASALADIGSALAGDGSTNPSPTPRSTAPDPAFAATSDSPARPTPTLGPLGPAPGRPTAATHTPSAPSPATVRVQRGDTLWAIAARHLGAHATASAIVTEWHRWYAANRAVVGGDPDLLVPGQLLTAPLPTSSPTAGQGASS